MKTKRVVTNCANCKREIALEKALSKREVSPGVWACGLACSCGHWHHGYYETEAMMAAQPVTKETRKAYGELFDCEQERIKELLRACPEGESPS